MPLLVHSSVSNMCLLLVHFNGNMGSAATLRYNHHVQLPFCCYPICTEIGSDAYGSHMHLQLATCEELLHDRQGPWLKVHLSKKLIQCIGFTARAIVSSFLTMFLLCNLTQFQRTMVVTRSRPQILTNPFDRRLLQLMMPMAIQCKNIQDPCSYSRACNHNGIPVCSLAWYAAAAPDV